MKGFDHVNFGVAQMEIYIQVKRWICFFLGTHSQEASEKFA